MRRLAMCRNLTEQPTKVDRRCRWTSIIERRRLLAHELDEGGTELGRRADGRVPLVVVFGADAAGAAVEDVDGAASVDAVVGRADGDVAVAVEVDVAQRRQRQPETRLHVNETR